MDEFELAAAVNRLENAEVIDATMEGDQEVSRSPRWSIEQRDYSFTI